MDVLRRILIFLKSFVSFGGIRRFGRVYMFFRDFVGYCLNFIKYCCFFLKGGRFKAWFGKWKVARLGGGWRIGRLNDWMAGVKSGW